MNFDLLDSEASKDAKKNKVEKPLELLQLDEIKEIFEQIEDPQNEQSAIDAFEYIYGIMDMHDESEIVGELRRFYSYRFETLNDAVDAFSHMVASLRFPSKTVSACLDDYRTELSREIKKSNNLNSIPIPASFIMSTKIWMNKFFVYLLDALFITKFINQNSTNYLRFVQELLRIDFKGKTDELILFLKEKEKLLLVVSRNPHFQKSGTKVLPSELDNPEFKVILKKAIDAGFVVENKTHYVWEGTNPQLAYFNEIVAIFLNLEHKDAPFLKLFNKKNLAQNRYKSKELLGKVNGQDEIDSLVRID